GRPPVARRRLIAGVIGATLVGACAATFLLKPSGRPEVAPGSTPGVAFTTPAVASALPDPPASTPIEMTSAAPPVATTAPPATQPATSGRVARQHKKSTDADLGY